MPVEHRNPRGSHNSKLFVSVVKLVRAEGKRWNLYLRTAWKFNINSVFVAQVPSKPICLQKELKRCYKTYIFLNKGWPLLTPPVSNCISWNCVPALWDCEVRKGDQESQGSPSSAPTGLLWLGIITFSCASSTFWDLINTMSCTERRLPGHDTLLQHR